MTPFLPARSGWENPENEGGKMLESHGNSQHFHENSDWCPKILLGNETGTALLGGFYGWGIQEVSIPLNSALKGWNVVPEVEKRDLTPGFYPCQAPALFFSKIWRSELGALLTPN